MSSEWDGWLSSEGVGWVGMDESEMDRLSLRSFQERIDRGE